MIPTRLLLIYFGLCALALGSVIYTWGCPIEVKQYGTAPEYLGGDGKNIGDYQLEDIEGSLRVAKPEDYVKLRERLDARAKPLRLDQREEWLEWRAQTKMSMLRLNFDYLDNLHPSLRLATFFAFTLGFSFLLLPAIDIFRRVLSILLRNLSS